MAIMHSQRGGKLGQSVRYAASTMAAANAHVGPSPLHHMHESIASRGQSGVYAAVASPLGSAHSQMSRSGSSRRSLFSFRPQSLKRGLGADGSGRSHNTDTMTPPAGRGAMIMSMSRRGSGGTVLIEGGVRRSSSKKGGTPGRNDGLTLDMDHIREASADDEEEDAKDEQKAIRAIGSDLNVVRFAGRLVCCETTLYTHSRRSTAGLCTTMCSCVRYPRRGSCACSTRQRTGWLVPWPSP